jgi:hypothetical protein
MGFFTTVKARADNIPAEDVTPADRQETRKASLKAASTLSVADSSFYKTRVVTTVCSTCYSKRSGAEMLVP